MMMTSIYFYFIYNHIIKTRNRVGDTQHGFSCKLAGINC